MQTMGIFFLALIAALLFVGYISGICEGIIESRKEKRGENGRKGKQSRISSNVETKKRDGTV